MVATTFLSAGTQSSESKLSNFLKSRYSQNPSIKHLNVTVVDSKVIPNSHDWKGVKLQLSGEYKGQKFSEKQIFFTDGKNFTETLTSLNGTDWKKIFTPKVDAKYYTKQHLLFGSENSKHKILIFSDPLCPYCQRSVPALLDYVKNYPKTFAVYYYHLPLERIHPASVTLTKLMYLAQLQGKTDLVSKAYFSRVGARESSDEKIVKAFNQATGLNYSVSDIHTQIVNEEILNDKKVANELEVRGTPTIFFDGNKSGGEFYKRVKKVD
jgi:protein-disulfide isomerase